MDDIVAVSQREDANKTTVILYLEGIFYKAYGHSAYLFVRHVREYLAKKYHYKKIKRDLCSIGFPKTVLNDLEREGKYQVTRDGKKATLEGGFPSVDEEDYQRWTDSTPLSVRDGRGGRPVAPPSPATLPPAPAAVLQPEEEAIQRIRKFAIANATPMECMSFLDELKRMLN